MFSFLSRKHKGPGNGKPQAVVPENVETTTADKYWDVYKSWRTRLERMASGLNDISRNIEDEFLSVGGNLQLFSDDCRKITASAGDIAHMLETGSGFQTGAFNQVFENVYGEIDSCCCEVSDRVCSMVEIMPRIQDIHSLRAFLNKLSKSITIIGTLIRIETSRVAEAEFSTMTAAIDDLARQIAKNTDDVAVSAKNVSDGITTINTDMRVGREKIQSELGLTRTRMNEIVEEMANMTSQAKWACKRIEGRSSQISPAIGEVIVALQSHDICRQQMQHVSEALHDIIARMSTMNDIPESERPTFGLWITEAVGIQILQLEHVISEAARAARGISEHLSRISDLAEAQQEDAAMILEDEESGSDRIVKISSEVQTLSDLMSDAKAMMVGTIDEITKVNDTVGGMSEQVSNIELISDNINLLSLNAIIKVAGTGDEGKGLGVLADEIRKLSSRANDQIAKGAGAINSILAGSSELGKALSEEMDRRLSSIEDIYQKTHSAVEDLLAADRNIMSSMGEITGVTRTLGDEIAKVVSGIRFDSTIAEGVGGMVAELRQMLTDVEAVVPVAGEGFETTSPDMEDLKSRYTIHSERMIHETRSISSVKEEPAGNVEFF